MATELKLTPSRMAGAVVFGTADGFDWRGLGVLSQLDKSVVSLLDMRGGVLRLQGFEDVGLPAWFAMPIRVGATDVTLLGVVRPCRDATNRPGLAGAGIGLAIRADEEAVPRWRAQQAFALANLLIDGLVQGRGFKARVDFAAWRWPESLNEAARLASPTPAAQMLRGPFRRQTVEPEWAVAVGDPGALFVDVLRTDPSGSLGSGLLIEAVNDDERRQRQHFTGEALSTRTEDVTRALQTRLREVQSRASAFDGQQRKVEDLTRRVRERDEELRKLRTLEAAWRAKANTADTYARQANQKIANVREKARIDSEKLKRDLKKVQSKEWANSMRALESMSEDKKLSAHTIARLARTLQRMVRANSGLAGAVIKGDQASTQDAEALSELTPEKKFNAALSYLGGLDDPLTDQSALADTTRGPGADEYQAVAPDYVPEAMPSFDASSTEAEPRFAPVEDGGTQRQPDMARKSVGESTQAGGYFAAPPPSAPSSSASGQYLDQARGMQTKQPVPQRESAPSQPPKSQDAGRLPAPGLVGAIIALVLVLVIAVHLMNMGSSGGEREPERWQEQSSSLRGSTASTLDCERADSRCLRVLNRGFDEAERAVERVARGDPSELDVATAATALGRFEDLHDLYDRALDAPDSASIEEALETIREEVAGDEGLGSIFLEALNDKRDALEAEGDTGEEFQRISGDFGALQEQFRRSKQPDSDNADAPNE